VQAYSAASQYSIVVRRERLAASSNAAVLQSPDSLPEDRAPSIQLARPWAAPVVQVDRGHDLDLVRVPDLAGLRDRVRALVALDRVALVAHHRLQKPDARSALHRAAVRVVSSSIQRLKKGR
jgi:hypothetical protein